MDLKKMRISTFLLHVITNITTCKIRKSFHWRSVYQTKIVFFWYCWYFALCLGSSVSQFICAFLRSYEWQPYMAISGRRPADRLNGRQTDLDKVKSSDWSKVRMLYRRGVIEVDEFDKVDICCGRKIRQIRNDRDELCHTRTLFCCCKLTAWTPTDWNADGFQRK